jgi:hypothetical protein
MIGIPLGLLYANAFEWVIHKHVLHGRGKSKKSFWSFHWHDHHNSARKNEMVDPQYTAPQGGWNPRTKEIASLAAAAAIHLPLLPVAPFFVATVCYSTLKYYRVHRRAHLDSEWAKEHLPWHYDHHMGPNQHSNWCVTRPWFDHIMGTREHYVGTERYQQDRRRHEARSATAPLRQAA